MGTSEWLKTIYKQLCCLITGQESVLEAIQSGGGGSYNSADQIELDEAGTTTHTFAIGDVHSFSFAVESGSVTLQYDGGDTLEYAEGWTGGADYSTYNDQTITLTIVSGNTKIMFQY